jgi:hypothetical protein
MTRPGITLRIACALAFACLLLGCARSVPDAEAARPRADTVLAVVPFGLAAGTPPPSVDVAEVIRSDLVALDGVAILPEADLPERPARLSEIGFERWRDAPVDYLVIGLIAGVHDGGHEVEFRLVDPGSERREQATRIGFIVASAPEALDATAHRIASMIRARLLEEGTGRPPEP